MAWDDTPPTPAELSQAPSTSWDAAPPTAAELQGTQAPTLLDKLNQGTADVGLGAIQGATLHTAPKLEGAVLAAIQKLKGATDDQGQAQSYGDLYKQYQDLASKRYAAAKARSPYLYGAGDVGGTLALGALTAGGGLELGAARGLGEAALQGGAIGAVSGLGSSTGDLTTEEGRQQAAKDILTGGAIGGVVGDLAEPVVSGIGSIGQYAGKKLSGALAGAADNPAIQRYIAAFKQGALGPEGQQFIGESAERQLAKKITGGSQELADQLVNARNQLSQGIGDSLEQTGERLDPSDLIDNATQKLSDLGQQQRTLTQTRDFDRFNAIFDDFKTAMGEDDTSVSPKELFNLRQNLIKFKANADQPELQDVANTAIEGIDSKLGNIPGYQDAMDSLKDFAAKGPELFLDKTVQSYGTDASDVLGDKIADATRRSSGLGGSDADIEARQKFQDLLDNFNDIEQAKPGYLKSLGIDDPEGMVANLREQANLEEIRKEISKPSTHGLLNPVRIAGDVIGSGLGLRSGSSQGTSLLVANQVGKGTSAVAGFSRALYQAPKNVLQGVADTMKANGFDTLGSYLSNSLESGNQSMTNAALFSIMQNPQTRKLLGVDQVKQEEKTQTPTGNRIF